MLDVRRLRLLRELHARGTVTAVAEALAYTPSAVSQQLAVLEREAGVELLERVGRGVRLTEAGRALVDHTEAVLARLEAAEADLAAAGSGEVSGRLRIACFQTAARGLVVPVLTSLPRRHPDLRLELREMEAEEALPLLRLGDVDVVVAEEYEHAPRPLDPGIERTVVCLDPMLVVLPEDHPEAAHGGPVALASLAGEQWVSANLGTTYAEFMASACRSLGGFEPDVRHRAYDVALLSELVAEDRAVALLPSLGRPGMVPGVAIRPPREAALVRRVFSAVREGAAGRPAIVALRAALGEQARAIGLPVS